MKKKSIFLAVVLFTSMFFLQPNNAQATCTFNVFYVSLPSTATNAEQIPVDVSVNWNCPDKPSNYRGMFWRIFDLSANKCYRFGSSTTTFTDCSTQNSFDLLSKGATGSFTTALILPSLSAGTHRILFEIWMDKVWASDQGFAGLEKTISVSSVSGSTAPTTATINYIYPATFTSGSASGSNLIVPPNTQVFVEIKLKASGATTANIQTEIRRDVVTWFDSTYQTLSTSQWLNSGDNVVKMGSFTTESNIDQTCNTAGCVREYFLKVLVNGNVVHDPQNPDNREWVTVTKAVTQPTTSTTASAAATNTQTTQTANCRGAITNIKYDGGILGIGSTATVKTEIKCPTPPANTRGSFVNLKIGGWCGRVGGDTQTGCTISSGNHRDLVDGVDEYVFAVPSLEAKQYNMNAELKLDVAFAADTTLASKTITVTGSGKLEGIINYLYLFIPIIILPLAAYFLAKENKLKWIVVGLVVGVILGAVLWWLVNLAWWQKILLGVGGGVIGGLLIYGVISIFGLGIFAIILRKTTGD